jgi:hypothetical protein
MQVHALYHYDGPTLARVILAADRYRGAEGRQTESERERERSLHGMSGVVVRKSTCRSFPVT